MAALLYPTLAPALSGRGGRKIGGYGRSVRWSAEAVVEGFEGVGDRLEVGVMEADGAIPGLAETAE